MTKASAKPATVDDERPQLRSGRAKEPQGAWWSQVKLSRDGARLPLYLQLAKTIRDAISEGKLVAGLRLPGTRALAALLGIHRNTVLEAYAELLSEGWLETNPKRGTFVAKSIPARLLPSRHKSTPTQAPFPLVPFPSAWDISWATDPAGIQLFGGVPDLRLLPTAAIARAYRRALRKAPQLLAYGDPQGDVALRRQLASLLRTTRALVVEPEQILVTRGSQMGLYLAAATLLRPDDVVVVEALGYPPAWEALRRSGARLVPCKVDSHGLDTRHLAKICQQQRLEKQPVRCVYVTPHHQYPSTVTLSPARRLQLRSLALEYAFVVLEDDYDHEFQYDGQPVLPVASQMPRSHMAYVGTLSKVLAPGFRVGYLVAPEEVLRRATALRFYLDRQGDSATEAALAELLEDGEIQRHIRKTRWIYQERRDKCVAGLRQRFGESLSFSTPAGGMALWIESRGPLVQHWLDAARALGVHFQSGRRFHFRSAGDRHLRLGFAGVSGEEMDEALNRLKTAWQRVC